MTCTITGTAGLPDGTVYPHARFLFYRLPQSVTSQDGRAVVPKTITVQSNASGAVSFELLPGNYAGTETATDTSFGFVVPDAASADWVDCLDAAAAPLVSSLPAQYVTMSGGGTAQDYAGFATRAAFVTWASGKTPAVGAVVSAAGMGYRYTGSGTVIADLPGWVEVADKRPDHHGATGNGTTNDATAIAAWKNALADRAYFSTSVTGHPDIRTPVDVDIKTASVTAWRIREDNTTLTGRVETTGADGFSVLVDGGVQGVTIRDMDIKNAGFGPLIKPAIGPDTNAIARQISVHGLNIRGSGTTADVGVSIDGNTESSIVFGNLISDLQRTDSVRPAHAYALAGLDGGGGPTADSRNNLFGFSAVYNVAGNVLHVEDQNPGTVSIGLLGLNIERGIEGVNDGVPYLQSHIGHSFAAWSLYAVDVVGTGSSRMQNYAFILMDGTNSTVASGPNVRINQQATRDINYIGNMHYDLTGDGIESTAEGRVHLAFNAWDTVSGAAIKGRATISATRGLLVHSNNSFRDVGSVVDKATAANIMGDRVSAPVMVIANIETEDVAFYAERPGFVTKVTRTLDDTIPPNGLNPNFIVLRRNSAGTETTIITNSVPRAMAARNVTAWTAENVQILNNIFEAGDLILVRCDGTGVANNRSAFIEIEFFYYN